MLSRTAVFLLHYPAERSQQRSYYRRYMVAAHNPQVKKAITKEKLNRLSERRELPAGLRTGAVQI